VIDDLQRVCVKLYATTPDAIADDVFVPVFHEWIRDRALDLVWVDVADYTHAPSSPGVMLISHEASVSLDRADRRFGLLVQRRRPVIGGLGDAIAAACRTALTVAARLEADPRLAGRLAFDADAVRVEANDRLRAPNTDEAFTAFAPYARAAAGAVFPGRPATITRVANDRRDRLAIDVRVAPPAAPAPAAPAPAAPAPAAPAPAAPAPAAPAPAAPPAGAPAAC
jgi:hypothetical protein